MSTTPALQTQFTTIRGWEQLTGMKRSTTYKELAVGHLRGKKCGARTLIDVPHGLAYLRGLPDAKINAPASPARSPTPA
jgi:hypothetical protein